MPDAPFTPQEPTRDRVQRMVRLRAAPEKVWEAIGGFRGLAGWHPHVASVEVVDINGETHRHVRTTGGDLFLERLIETGPHHLTYATVDGPLPVASHRATLSVVPEKDGCHVFWGAIFEPAVGAEAVADEVVSAYYEAGLDALRARFAG